ncbi:MULTISPECIES: endonuclease/exonuclease/phosphatase family protein [unclassified Lentimicrobium]|uniref:endonuclease/exonuclease/phosphatase family protein n=1 Tax=unclassified Lentimicrobium TaxID=2677434 RepID=UPI001551CF9A|nr:MULTISPECIES: endonuclease/exonuclease/phosphatase family protein [unclassified Lentimicrobium]NPD46187.1 endonuclease/exonuclease/phosphatase family protein [Lentimicrobium sp. S6]NPD83238.1 endonuclease/exonuclease/phosphatase family protein [Lentimicrobium sp. L6]
MSYALVLDHFQFFNESTIADSKASSFAILSFNARNLSNNNLSVGDKSIRNEIAGYVESQNADLICFQEFQSYPTKGVNSVEDYKKKLQRPHVFSAPYLKKNNHQFLDLLVMYSKYTIKNSKTFYMDGKIYGFYVDLEIENEMIRLFNLHLESNHFNKNDYDIFSDKEVNLNQKKRNQVVLLVQKLKKYSVKRSYQARTIRTEIEDSPYPVIVAGDFNDTPASYIYHHIRQDLLDAFKLKGSGYSNTYNGNLPPMRIDFMLFDPQMKIHDYQVLKPDLSDHYPILTHFTIQ